MKALVYHGPGRRAWEEAPDAVIHEPTDAVVRVDAVTICGTDLHILGGDVPEWLLTVLLDKTDDPRIGLKGPARRAIWGGCSGVPGTPAFGERERISNDVLEVISWDPEDHPDVPGLAHGITRYGGHWFDVGVSVVPGEVDALEALETVFAKLRQILVREKPDVEYFSVDLRVASATPIPRP